MKWDVQVEGKVQVTAGWCQMVFASVSECFQVRLVLIVCSHPLSLVVCTFTSLIFVWLYYVSIAESG